MKRWWGLIRPVSACSSSGRLRRNWPWANSASAAASSCPATSSPEHRPRRDPGDVADHAGQLDVGPFQRLLEAVDLGGALPHQTAPVAGQLPQLACGPIGHETAAQQSMAQQIRQPFGIAHIALASGHHLDVGGIDQQQREPVLQQIPDRLPVDAGALHREWVTPPCANQSPRATVRGHGPKGPRLLARPPVRSEIIRQAVTERLCRSAHNSAHTPHP